MNIINYRLFDWETMIILDACRYDYFYFLCISETFPLKGNLQKANSGACNTPEWYETHWQRHFAKDIVLISANPKPFSRSGWNLKYNAPIYKGFLKAIPAWRDEKIDPYATIDFYLKERVKGKQHIIHFIPPHLPYFIDEGKAFLSSIDVGSKRQSIYKSLQKYAGEDASRWKLLRAMYQLNLSRMLKILKDNLSIFRGKTIITSDHGEILGEKQIYDHPRSKDTPEYLKSFLLNVPLFEVQK